MRTGPDNSDDLGDGDGGGATPPQVAIRPAVFEDLATVRYIHDNAFKRDAPAYFSEDEIAAFSRHVQTPGYGDKLIAEGLQVAVLGHDLVGTAAWTGVPDGRATARIRHVYVRPLFSGLGIGHHLVEAMESQAARAGYDLLTVRATLNAVGFFESRGYAVASFGTRVLTADTSLAVAFMRKPRSDGAVH